MFHQPYLAHNPSFFLILYISSYLGCGAAKGTLKSQASRWKRWKMWLEFGHPGLACLDESPVTCTTPWPCSTSMLGHKPPELILTKAFSFNVKRNRYDFSLPYPPGTNISHLGFTSAYLKGWYVSSQEGIQNHSATNMILDTSTSYFSPAQGATKTPYCGICVSRFNPVYPMHWPIIWENWLLFVPEKNMLDHFGLFSDPSSLIKKRPKCSSKQNDQTTLAASSSAFSFSLALLEGWFVLCLFWDPKKRRSYFALFSGSHQHAPWRSWIIHPQWRIYWYAVLLWDFVVQVSLGFERLAQFKRHL